MDVCSASVVPCDQYHTVTMPIVVGVRWFQMEVSPSIPHVYSIECALRVTPLSNARSVAPLAAKKATVTVGRDARRKLLLVVGVSGSRPFESSYALRDCKVHTKNVTTGKGTIVIEKMGVALHLSNAPPRQINVFLKSIEAKLELMNAEGGGQKTPVSKARNLLLTGVPEVFTELSPLTIGEMRKVRRLRGCPIPSPMAKETRRDTPKGRGTATTPKNGAAKRPLPSETPTTSNERRPLRTVQSTSLLRKPLSAEQREVVKAVVEQRQNVFFTGAAGTGKSVVLGRIVEMLPASTTVISAATGVAACHLGGVTLHAFAGIGASPMSVETAVKMVEGKKSVAKQWRSTTHLVIDEISMIDGHYFSILEGVARVIRRSDAPFGGIQLILTGDFLQLPPVCKGNETKSFAFETEAWNRCVGRTMVLREVRRQEGDEQFVNLLQQIRMGRCDIISERLLVESKKNEVERNGVVATRLCTHTADAESINNEKLRELEEEQRVFLAEDSSYIPDCVKVAVRDKLVLKKGAQVMLTSNIDVSRQLCNGARGVVESFSEKGWPRVRFKAVDEVIELAPLRTRIRLPGGEDAVALRSQIPLQLAWAISIHKSQGLTLDAVEVSLSRVFAEGQAYVALSRSRSLSSLKVLDFDIDAVRANQKVVKYYESLMTAPDDCDDFVIFKRRRTE